jgi:hypothetical protein
MFCVSIPPLGSSRASESPRTCLRSLTYACAPNGRKGVGVGVSGAPSVRQGLPLLDVLDDTFNPSGSMTSLKTLGTRQIGDGTGFSLKIDVSRGVRAFLGNTPITTMEAPATGFGSTRIPP